MTNLVYRCSSPAATTTANATVIVRVFGQGGKLFSQKDERNIFLLASELGLGPKCLVSSAFASHPLALHQRALSGTPPCALYSCHPSCLAAHPPPALRPPLQVEFDNGRVEEFLPGDNLSCDTMRRPEVSAAIAQALAVFHVRMLARLPAATAGAAAVETQQGSATNGSDGAAASSQKPRQGAVALLRPAIYQRIRQWHAAAQDMCAAELQLLGLASLLQEVGSSADSCWMGGRASISALQPSTAAAPAGADCSPACHSLPACATCLPAAGRIGGAPGSSTPLLGGLLPQRLAVWQHAALPSNRQQRQRRRRCRYGCGAAADARGRGRGRRSSAGRGSASSSRRGQLRQTQQPLSSPSSSWQQRRQRRNLCQAD